MSRFYIGQPVVCLSGYETTSPRTRRFSQTHGITWPEKGRRYVVRDYVISVEGLDGIVLEEIANPVVRYSNGAQAEASFSDTRFGPITDISELEKLCTRATEDA